MDTHDITYFDTLKAKDPVYLDVIYDKGCDGSQEVLRIIRSKTKT